MRSMHDLMQRNRSHFITFLLLIFSFLTPNLNIVSIVATSIKYPHIIIRMTIIIPKDSHII